jgi:hypothetical protein
MNKYPITKMALPADPPFLRPWRPLFGDRARFFEQELARELGPDHPLHDRPFVAVAIAGESDDLFFRLDDGTFAQVHLTYTRSPPETVTALPRTQIFETLADWMLAAMVPDHVDHFGLWDDGW